MKLRQACISLGIAHRGVQFCSDARPSLGVQSPRRRVITMTTTVQEYRANARQCLSWAELAREPENRDAFFALAATWEGVATWVERLTAAPEIGAIRRTFTPSGGCGLAVAAGPALCDEFPAVWRCWRRSPSALALACVQEGSHRPPNPCIPVAVSTRRPHTDLLMLSVLDHMFPALTQWRPLVSCRDWRWYGGSDAKGNAGQCQPTCYGS